MKREWDAGNAGCGRFVFDLARKVNQLSPGDTLRITAHDSGVATDLPAWCRMTGHTLIFAEHPVYEIRRKET